MKGALGFGGITLGFMAAALGVLTMAVGIHRRDGRIMATGRQFVFMVLLGAVIAAGAMEWALVTHDFSIAYVVKNHSRSTPLLYTVAALWGARGVDPVVGAGALRLPDGDRAAAAGPGRSR